MFCTAFHGESRGDVRIGGTWQNGNKQKPKSVRTCWWPKHAPKLIRSREFKHGIAPKLDHDRLGLNKGRRLGLQRLAITRSRKFWPVHSQSITLLRCQSCTIPVELEQNAISVVTQMVFSPQRLRISRDSHLPPFAPPIKPTYQVTVYKYTNLRDWCGLI